MKILLLLTCLTGLFAKAGSVAEDLIALSANGASLGLYSRQLEVDMQKAKLEIEKEYAEKMKRIVETAKKDRMATLSEKLKRSESTSLQAKHLLGKTNDSIANFKSLSVLAQSSLAGDLELSENLIFLAESLRSQGHAFVNLGQFVQMRNQTAESCQNNLECEWLQVNGSVEAQAQNLGVTAEEFLKLSIAFSTPEQLTQNLSVIQTAEETMRRAKIALSVKVKSLEVEIDGLKKSIEKLSK